MGWDFHFFRTKKIGDILQDENIKEEHIEDDNVYGKRIYLYTMHEGEKSGIVVPNLNENYYNDYLGYAYMRYGGNALYFIWYLYKHFGIMFADSYMMDLYYLQEYCENVDEELDLIHYVCANEMLGIYKDIENEEDLSELNTFYTKGKILYDKLYEKFKESKTQMPQQEIPQQEHIIVKDDDELPF